MSAPISILDDEIFKPFPGESDFNIIRSECSKSLNHLERKVRDVAGIIGDVALLTVLSPFIISGTIIGITVFRTMTSGLEFADYVPEGVEERRSNMYDGETVSAASNQTQVELVNGNYVRA